MPPLFGRGLAAPVLRPLAERLIDVAQLRPDDRLILDAPCDGGVLSAALGRRGRSGRLVVGVDGDGRALVEAAAAGSGALFIAAKVADVPLAGRCVDVAISLLTLAHQADPAAVLASCAATLRSHGRLIAAAWGDRAEVPHLAALGDAVRATTGRVPGYIEDALSLGEPGALEALAARTGLVAARVDRLRDVVRFEGVDHLWGVHCAGPLADEAAGLDADSTRALAQDLANRLLAVTAWDGTLVVPVEMAVLTATPG